MFSDFKACQAPSREKEIPSHGTVHKHVALSRDSAPVCQGLSPEEGGAEGLEPISQAGGSDGQMLLLRQQVLIPLSFLACTATDKG